ncbi:MAG: NAD(P)(+) transhydrogenase (Re/Si-specific) subunit beta [Flavobacteriales bacterium]|nr:NAD(P)(+) transhydrogenase (Re/Si-specific) subunit beta [Flavobacteriales bacterium]MCB9364574.1 NAD(P)(+) transhydrogenase (Re/Si-specific) subunit beta [Flavobacteriales bacterium]
MDLLINIAYLFAAIGFILGLKLMGNPAKAKLGNYFAATGMAIAIVATAVLILNDSPKVTNVIFLISALTIGTIIGRVMAYKVEMTGMPQLVSLFNALGGAAAVIISINEAVININTPLSLIINIALALGAILGGVSFTGSIVAYFKLANKFNIGNQNAAKIVARFLLLSIIGVSVIFFSSNILGISFLSYLMLISIVSLLYGIVFTVPIGGADMPVLVSFLNAITGVATAFSGIAFNSPIMLIGGILVGATGVYLTMQMCTAMNRSLGVVLAGKITSGEIPQGANSNIEVQRISAVETASLLAFSKKIAIIPGYGMAVAQAQQACYELQKKLMEKGAQVTYIIHPVAGRMPGHMNVLLAEANIDYKYIKDMVDVNDVMEQFDAAIIIGANDVVNPAAESDENSVIYGMPIIKAYQAKQVIMMKRGMATGYSGAVNPLFGRRNCKILFGDAKDSLVQINDELKNI